LWGLGIKGLAGRLGRKEEINLKKDEWESDNRLDLRGFPLYLQPVRLLQFEFENLRLGNSFL